jgi:hypothetical protein
MTLVIPPPRRPYLYSDGVTTTIPPNPISTQIRTHVPPILDGAEAYRTKSMATACCTSGWRGQKLNAHNVSALQGKLLTPDKEKDGHTQDHLFCYSLLSFSHFTFFTTNVTRALTLETIKREAEATSLR